MTEGAPQAPIDPLREAVEQIRNAVAQRDAGETNAALLSVLLALAFAQIATAAHTGQLVAIDKARLDQAAAERAARQLRN